MSGGWRYLAQRLNGDGTGTFLNTDVALTDVSISDVLSGPPGLTANVPVEMRALKADDGRPLLEPWSTALYAEIDGVIRAGGLLVDRTANGAVLGLDCMGFTGYPTGMPYIGSVAHVDVDPMDMARHIWDHLQTQPGGDLGLFWEEEVASPVRIGSALEQVQFDTVSGPLSFESGPYKLNWYQTDDLGREFDSLAQETPFDYHETHRWNSERTDILHVLTFGYPRLGTRRQDLRFVYGENINVTPSIAAGGDDYANGVMVLGSGEGRDMIRSDIVSVSDGRLRRVRVVTDKSIRSRARAVNRARQELALSRVTDGVIAEISVREHPHAPLGSWVVGDDIFVEAGTGWDVVAGWYRIVASTITPDAPDVATLTLIGSATA